ncbi:MAG: response regulator transcription factor [Ardenticatenaceae bacterium]|nr:response regulator transcription factor [Ardenticatenaceae bacterium]
MAKHILVVDDDTLMRRSLSLYLEQAGFRCSTAGSAETALAAARMERPDLVLLDIGLPGMDGLQALKQFQQEMDMPIIFVTARRRELDEILGLELGADNYITKPFNPDVLLAHVKATLRRTRDKSPMTVTPVPIHVGDLVIDVAAHTVMVGERPIELAAREFALLHALALEAGHVVSVDDLLDRVWGAEFMGEPQVVYVHVRWLREKIEANPNKPERLVTVRGVGYKLMPIGGKS